jgi:hypothetical protein
VFQDGRRLGFEVKYTDRPAMTGSLRLALDELRLDELTVVIPGDADYALTDRVRVRGLSRVVTGA